MDSIFEAWIGTPTVPLSMGAHARGAGDRRQGRKRLLRIWRSKRHCSTDAPATPVAQSATCAGVIECWIPSIIDNEL